MKATMLHIAEILLVWTVLSVAAGAALSRILQRLQRTDESFGEVYVPPSVDDWSEESLDALLAATTDPDFVESVLRDLVELETREERS